MVVTEKTRKQELELPTKISLVAPRELVTPEATFAVMAIATGATSEGTYSTMQRASRSAYVAGNREGLATGAELVTLAFQALAVLD